MAIETEQRRLLVNGEKPSADLLAQMAAALGNPTVLKAHGGFLLRAAWGRDGFHVGIVPAVVEGQRSYHFAMNFPDAAVSLTGFVEPDGRLSIFLARPGRPAELSADERELGRSLYEHFARFLLKAGVNPRTELHALTQQALCEAGLADPAPATLGELADVVRTPYVGN